MNHRDAENHVSKVLKSDPTPEQLDEALQIFMDSRRNYYKEHGYWVHSLSHFTGELWKLGRMDWIKRFNEVAFTGANELGDSNCCDRLVSDFTYKAAWDQDPRDFHITLEMLEWMETKSDYLSELIVVAPFESEIALIRFKLKHKRGVLGWNSDAQQSLVDVKGVRSQIERLQELGDDVSDLSTFEHDLLTERLATLEAELSTAEVDWQRERAQKGIEITKAALGQ